MSNSHPAYEVHQCSYFSFVCFLDIINLIHKKIEFIQPHKKKYKHHHTK